MAEQYMELTPEQLRQVCDPGVFTFRGTDELPALEETIGQERAMRAAAFGIDIDTSGYHLFALGPSGTGKTTTLLKFLQREAGTHPVPADWLYVNNFANPDQPRALQLPAGTGNRLQTDMNRLVDELRSVVPRVFESAEYSKQQEEVGNQAQQQHQALLEEMNRYAQSRGMAIVTTPQGLLIAPVANGTVLGPDKLQQIDEATKQKMAANEQEVQTKLRDTMRQIQQIQRQTRERIIELDRQAVGNAVGHLLDELRERYASFPSVIALLDDIRQDIVENAQTFKDIRQLEQMQAEQAPMAAFLGRQLPTFEQYRVNLLVDNSETKGAPVILARNPSYHNLVGRIEHLGQFGTLVTNFNLIKGGLLHKANGGYLLVEARDVLTKPLAWEGLSRALKNKLVEIESLLEAYGMFATRTLTPEPIPLHLKVVLLGDPMIYYLLFAYDPDFRELFKVKVDFASRMERSPETTDQYARFIATVCREETLKPFDPSGVAKVVEHGARLVEHQQKLATKFGDIVDLVRQASYWAGKNGHPTVSAADVAHALDEKVYRSNQIQQLLEEMIGEGTLLIDTEGTQVGQVNGLAVLSLGDYAFGKPSRITAIIHVGNAGVVNIDREAKMGGRIHNKGAMILAGYLGGKYAGDLPLALSASITFEQVYEEIEGDSASSTELYALLSGLSGFPLRQDLAVTGSVNQHGQVQAIGGVNEKIEGYFDVCRLTGLTGRQGVIIPQSNARHLMLRDDVVAAAREGKFHIYTVATIDDGIALLTGHPAGERAPDGTYPDGTVNAAVQLRLRELAKKEKGFMQPEDKLGKEEGEQKDEE